MGKTLLTDVVFSQHCENTSAEKAYRSYKWPEIKNDGILIVSFASGTLSMTFYHPSIISLDLHLWLTSFFRHDRRLSLEVVRSNIRYHAKVLENPYTRLNTIFLPPPIIFIIIEN